MMYELNHVMFCMFMFHVDYRTENESRIEIIAIAFDGSKPLESSNIKP